MRKNAIFCPIVAKNGEEKRPFDKNRRFCGGFFCFRVFFRLFVVNGGAFGIPASFVLFCIDSKKLR